MKRKNLIIISSVVIVGVTAFIVINRIHKKKMINAINDALDGKTSDVTSIKLSASQVEELPNLNFPLKLGMNGKQVLLLQQALNKKYDANIALDGKFGQSTASALCKNYFSTCYTDVQSRLYEVTNEDYNKINS